MTSSEGKGFFTGLMLGDGFIDKGITKRAFRIKSIYSDYIYFIKKCFDTANVFTIEIKSFPESFKSNTHHKKYYELYIKSHPYFAKKYSHFYDDKKHRTISTEMMNSLNDIGLATWFMSDGYVCLVGKTKNKIINRRVEICTDRYKLVDIIKIRYYLNKNFDINTSIIKRGNRYRIRILRDSYQNFFDRIRQYIVPSMNYKLYLGYEKQPEWMSDEFWKLQEDLNSAITHLAG